MVISTYPREVVNAREAVDLADPTGRGLLLDSVDLHLVATAVLAHLVAVVVVGVVVVPESNDKT